MSYLNKEFGRREAIKKSSLAVIATTGMGAMTKPVAAINDGETTSDGDYDTNTFEDGASRGELAIGASVEDKDPYTDPPGPVFLNWCATVGESSARHVISDLEMEVRILEHSSDGDSWLFQNSSYSYEEAPKGDGYEPSFGVSAGFLIFSAGVSFSLGGSESDPPQAGETTVSHDFGEVARSPLYQPEVDGNSGWLWVSLHEPYYSELDDPTVVLYVVATATHEFHAGCPTHCNIMTEELRCAELVEVDFSN